MSTPTPGAPTTPPASPAEATRPPDPGTPGSLPWEAAARELSRCVSQRVAEEIVRIACEQWARSSTEHRRQHDAEMHKALALCRSVLTFADTVIDECRPLVKGRLMDTELRFPNAPTDDSILDRISEAQTRIDKALKGGAP